MFFKFSLKIDKVDILRISGFIKKKKEQFLQHTKLYLSNTLSYLWQVVHVATVQSRTGTGLRLGDTDMAL